MSTQRWRGPRRPDVNELRHTTKAAAEEKEGDASSSSSTAQHKFISSSHDDHHDYQGSPAVRHFRYNFLSAGTSQLEATASHQHAQQQQQQRAMNGSITQQQFNDSFPSTTTSSVSHTSPSSTSAIHARSYDVSQRDRYASGLGYGTRHGNHFNYLSKQQPPRGAEEFDERPCLYPTLEMPTQGQIFRKTSTAVLASSSSPTAAADPLHPTSTRTISDLETLPFAEQEEDARAYKTRTAGGLGFGAKQRTYHAYLANPYWRK